MKDQCPSLDRISSLPSLIIETILCWLPLQEAGRTSILSRSWRYHWTKIPKLMIGPEFRAPASKNQLPVLEQTSDNPEQETWYIRRDDNIIIDDHSTIIELFNCLPLLEELSIAQIEYFAGGVVPLVLPTPLIHLKYLYIDRMFSTDDYELSFLLFMLRSSPNLEKIYLEVAVDDSIDEIRYEGTAPWQHHWDIWLEHFVELVIENFSTSMPEMKLVKLILAKSPLLKKVTISLDELIDVNREVKMLKTLLRFPRASLFVDIVVDSG